MCNNNLKVGKIQKMSSWRWNYQQNQTVANQFMGLGFGNFFIPTNKIVIVEQINAVLVPNVFFGNAWRANIDYYLEIVLNFNKEFDLNWNYLGDTNTPVVVFPLNEATLTLNKYQNTISGLQIPCDVLSVGGLIQVQSFDGLPKSLDIDIRLSVLYRDLLE